MTGKEYYSGAIWTIHARERLGQRGLNQEMAAKTFNYPEKQRVGKKSGTTEFQKRFGKSVVTVIATQNNQSQWIILSCWINPPLYGTLDYKKREKYKQYHQAGFWTKIWLTIKESLGW